MTQVTHNNGLFSYRTAEDLFAKVQRDWVAFYNDPDDDKLLNLLFPLYHLREWIHPHKFAYQKRDRSTWSREEQLFDDLYNNDAYKLICGLCNNAKHYNDKIGEPTTVQVGFLMGVNGAGDSLGHINHMIGWQPLRDAAQEVYGIYYRYFNKR